MNNNNVKLKGNLMLLLTAFIWGSAFVAQSVSMDYMGPFTFIAIRFLIGGLVLIPIYRYINKKSPETAAKYDNKSTLKGGIICGVALFAASGCQQIGMMSTSTGKAGFITALYIVIVPVLGLFTKRRIQLRIWLSVAIATVGLYLLCIKENFTISHGDFFILLCALIFSVHMLMLTKYSPKADCIKMSSIQFFTCSVLAVPFMLFTESTGVDAILSAWLPILYAGVLSSGVAYTLQVIAFKTMRPEVASIILSLESVFAAVSGWIILHETLSGKELIGCLLMFIAVILAQLPQKEQQQVNNTVY